MIALLRLRFLSWSLNRRLRKFQAELQRVTDERRAQFAAAHPDYDRRRKAALRHEPRSWA